MLRRKFLKRIFQFTAGLLALEVVPEMPLLRRINTTLLTPNNANAACIRDICTESDVCDTGDSGHTCAQVDVCGNDQSGDCMADYCTSDRSSNCTFDRCTADPSGGGCFIDTAQHARRAKIPEPKSIDRVFSKHMHMLESGEWYIWDHLAAVIAIDPGLCEQF